MAKRKECSCGKQIPPTHRKCAQCKRARKLAYDIRYSILVRRKRKALRKKRK